jgi:tetratricopeptide (TPR) repeat protein
MYNDANMTRLLSVLSLGLFMVCLAGTAYADKPLSKAAKEKAAKKACATGDFVKGVDILADLFVDTNEFSYVYNQGRCYQQANRWEQAISRFREYLRKAKDISESDRIETDRQIADCEASLGKTAQVAPPPVAATPAVPVIHPETPPQVLDPATSNVSSKPEPSPSVGSRGRGRGLRVTGIILAAVGVAAVGTGVGLALKAQGLSTKDFSQSREDERASLKTGSLVSYGVGAAAIATGAILYIVGWPSEQTSSVALLPVAAPGGASVLLKGRF